MKTVVAPHMLAPPAIVSSADGETVLEACNMASMVGVLQQLGWLASYSHEVMTDLANEAERGVQRIAGLKGRLQRVADRLGRVDDAVNAATEEELTEICMGNPAADFKATFNEESSLFGPESRSGSMQAAFEEARPPPGLDLLDGFIDHAAAPSKYAAHFPETCASAFPDPFFFLQMWMDDEEKKRAVLNI